MSQTVNSPGLNRFGMNNKDSVEATCTPVGGPPLNDPNINISSGKCVAVLAL